MFAKPDLTSEWLGEFLTVMQTREDVEGCITVSNSPSPSSVYIRLCKHGKKVFYCLNIAFLEKYSYFAVYKQFI